MRNKRCGGKKQGGQSHRDRRPICTVVQQKQNEVRVHRKRLDDRSRRRRQLWGIELPTKKVTLTIEDNVRAKVCRRQRRSATLSSAGTHTQHTHTHTTHDSYIKRDKTVKTLYKRPPTGG